MRIISAQDTLLSVASVPRNIASVIDPINSIAKTGALYAQEAEKAKAKRLVHLQRELREFLSDFFIDAYEVSILK